MASQLKNLFTAAQSAGPALGRTLGLLAAAGILGGAAYNSLYQGFYLIISFDNFIRKK
jgi:hypothetical protein